MVHPSRRCVYTTSHFLHHLVELIRPYPNASSLRLGSCSSSCSSCSNPTGERLLVQAVLIEAHNHVREPLDESPSSASLEHVVAAFFIEDDLAHFTSRWCARLQRSLSIASLLLSPPLRATIDGGRPPPLFLAHFEWRGTSEVASMQWQRCTDGILGSHQYCCHTYTLPECQLAIGTDDAGGAVEPSTSLAAASFCIRVGAILNGQIPMGRAAESHTCILFLCAVEGQLLTPDCPMGGQLNSEQHFGTVHDFIASLVPRVSLQAVRGRWAHGHEDTTTAALGEMDDDVCGVKASLGRSYYCHYYARCSAASDSTDARDGPMMRAALPHVQSVTFVVDVSLPLWNCLISPAAAARRSSIACGIVQSIEAALGQLAAAHIDQFSFATPAATSSLTTQLPAPHFLYTRELLCRSISASVAHIVQLSTNMDFITEAERLLSFVKGDEEKLKHLPKQRKRKSLSCVDEAAAAAVDNEKEDVEEAAAVGAPSATVWAPSQRPVPAPPPHQLPRLSGAEFQATLERRLLELYGSSMCPARIAASTEE